MGMPIFTCLDLPKNITGRSPVSEPLAADLKDSIRDFLLQASEGLP